MKSSLFIKLLGAAFLIDRFSLRPRFASIITMVLLMLILFGVLGTMTKLLGRLDVALSPLSQQQRQQLAQKLIAESKHQRDAALQRVKIAQDRVNAARSPGELQSAKKDLDDAVAAAAKLEQRYSQLEQGRDLPSDFYNRVASLPFIIATPIALAHRAVIAVPRENTLSYAYWSSQPHAPGSGWLTDLGGIMPGTQSQLSNELSDVNKGGSQGNSPLGLATDVFYNWGWLGVIIVPALYALGFLWLDIALTASRSGLTSAAKIFIFFSIPLMYSPFMFVLYGGFVAVGILCYAWLRQKGALSFLEMRLQTRQSPH